MLRGVQCTFNFKNQNPKLCSILPAAKRRLRTHLTYPLRVWGLLLQPPTKTLNFYILLNLIPFTYSRNVQLYSNIIVCENTFSFFRFFFTTVPSMNYSGACLSFNFFLLLHTHTQYSCSCKTGKGGRVKRQSLLNNNNFVSNL